MKGANSFGARRREKTFRAEAVEEKSDFKPQQNKNKQNMTMARISLKTRKRYAYAKNARNAPSTLKGT